MKKPAKKPAAKKPAAKKAKPSLGTVSVAKTGSVKDVALTEGMTVEQALKEAGHSTGRGVEVRLNNQKVTDMSTVLKNGDILMVVGAVRGA